MSDDQGENFGLSASSVTSDEDTSDDEILEFKDDGIDYAKLWDEQSTKPKSAELQDIKMDNSLKEELKIFTLNKDLKEFTPADDAYLEKLGIVHELETVIKSGEYKKFIKQQEISQPEPAPAKVNSPPVIASIVTPPHNQTSEAAPEDEDNAIQNLLDDTRFLTQFDDEINDFTETAVEEKKKMTKQGKAEKQKDYPCSYCKAEFSSLNDLQLHMDSSCTIESDSESNKKSEEKRVVAVPCVSAPMVVTQSRVPTGQHTGIVTLPGGQPVLANAAVSSAGVHHIRHTAPGHNFAGVQTRPPLAGGRTVFINEKSGSRISVPSHRVHRVQAGKIFCQFYSKISLSC